MELTIIFIGLIMHVNQPGSLDNTAVLPYAPHHEAKMVIPYAAIEGPVDPEWDSITCDTEECTVELAGYTVTVGGTKGVFSRMSADLVDAMPSITILAPKCGGLRAEVRNRRRGANEFTAFIDYRGGRRRLVSTFNEKASFPSKPPWDVERCLACEVAYESDLEGDYATLSFASHEHGGVRQLLIKRGWTLRVEHLYEDGTQDPDKPSHFGYYYRIFEKTNCEQPLPWVSETPCPDPHCKIPFPQADCTNSTYP